MKTLYQSIILFAMTVLLAACTKSEVATQKFALKDITEAPWGKDFQLTDHNGQTRTLANFKGKVVVIFFGYANCPDMCPMTMHKLSLVMEKLGSDAERVQVLMVTLDPERDTPQVLKQYVPAFHPTFLGLYGDDQTTEKTVQEFKLYYKKQKPDANGFYTVDHMGPAYIFDPQGRIRLLASDEHSVEAIAEDVRALLKARG